MNNKQNSIAPPLTLQNLLKWLIIIVAAGVLIGSASAFFLITLTWVTDYREANVWIITLLPIAGLSIGLAYHYWGKEAAKGNNLLLEEYHEPRKIVPFIMAPLVLFGTLITHLFGGSAGREGTAVQMGGAIADQFTSLFKLGPRDRQIIIIIGISAGFASVFGTPLAGAVFAIEVMALRRMRFDALLPSLLAAFIADYTCRLWGVPHTHYKIDIVPNISAATALWALAAGVIFGVTAWLFAKFSHLFDKVFSYVKYPPIRPFIGGIVIIIAVFAMGTTRYIGLGIPTISEAFRTPSSQHDFILKLLFTTFTLSAGFKGGEVTPLFFIGATLGSALSVFIPLPFALLAG
ncbi:chloride channel protein, partial [Nostoc linckia z13]|uniref:chloride channel protein n=1 Tax=Nostoc linckia TaxID=92942 RepID=UPI000BFFC698